MSDACQSATHAPLPPTHFPHTPGPTLSPASAPANAAIGGGATAQLQPGVMPFTQDQLGCFIAASAKSTAVQTYFDVSALLGLAAVYGGNATGPGAELLADVMASPDALDLMELPLKNVSDAFEAWVDEAMQACGMPQLTDDSGAELTSGEGCGGGMGAPSPVSAVSAVAVSAGAVSAVSACERWGPAAAQRWERRLAAYSLPRNPRSMPMSLQST